MNTPNPLEPEKGNPLVLGSRTDNYIAKAILLEEAAPPVYWQTTVKLIAYSLGAFFIWALFANLDVVATAPGQVMPVQAVKIIQHVDGGRIAEIAVVDGQEVIMDVKSNDGSLYNYEGVVNCENAGKFGYSIRVMADKEELVSRFHFGKIRWEAVR